MHIQAACKNDRILIILTYFTYLF